MPYKHIDLKIPKDKDKRIKLSDEQKAEIKNLYGKISQRKLAEMYGVSRRLIIFIGDERQAQRNKETYKERGGSMAYYDKEKHRVAMQKHRHYKQELYLKEELRDEK